MKNTAKYISITLLFLLSYTTLSIFGGKEKVNKHMAKLYKI